MKKIFYFLCFALCIGVSTSCSTTEPELFCTIYGIVIDKTTGEPVCNAAIKLTPGGKSIVSGSDGSYQFDNLDSHQYTIQVQKEGYKTDQKLANPVVGESVRVDFLLVTLP